MSEKLGFVPEIPGMIKNDPERGEFPIAINIVRDSKLKLGESLALRKSNKDEDLKTAERPSLYFTVSLSRFTH